MLKFKMEGIYKYLLTHAMNVESLSVLVLTVQHNHQLWQECMETICIILCQCDVQNPVLNVACILYVCRQWNQQALNQILSLNLNLNLNLGLGLLDHQPTATAPCPLRKVPGEHLHQPVNHLLRGTRQNIPKHM